MDFIFLLLLSLLANFSFALPPHSQPRAQVSVPSDENVLIPLTTEKSSLSALPQTMTLITWNVLKGDKGAAWTRDLSLLAQNTELLALQEAMDDDFMPKALEQLESFSFFLARSFMYDDGRSTGVSTGARALPLSIDFRRSPGREPVLNTPKMTIITSYAMTDGIPLLVLNIHGINFVASNQLSKQLDELRPLIANWSGRVALLGDFNTWNSSRKEILDSFTKNLGLIHVAFTSKQKPDPRKKILDHVFLRGCTPVKAEVLDHIKTSDHAPLSVKMHCD